MTRTVHRARRAAPAPARSRARLTRQAMALALLLLVQFFLGMVTNLYVTIPDKHPGAGAKDFFSGAPRSVAWAISSGPAWLAAHAALGLALCLVSILFIVTAARARDRMWIWLSVAGCLLMIGAAFNGASFVTYNHDFSSLIMAGLFALALASYLAGIYYASRRALPRLCR
jgi:hypothetical protein